MLHQPWRNAKSREDKKSSGAAVRGAGAVAPDFDTTEGMGVVVAALLPPPCTEDVPVNWAPLPAANGPAESGFAAPNGFPESALVNDTGGKSPPSPTAEVLPQSLRVTMLTFPQPVGPVLGI